MLSAELLSLIEKQIEAVLFVATLPVSEEELATTIGVSITAIQTGLKRLKDHYAEGHSLTLIRQGGGWQLATSSDVGDIVSLFRNTSLEQRVRLSKAALETLAVVAYNQPVTRSEVEEIRTVRSDRVIDTLVKHGLVRIAGRKKSMGMPLLYRTTERFLDLFGLESIASLPRLEDLQDIVVAEGLEWGDEDE